MELTEEHYRLAAVAYNAYCKQTGGKSLATGDVLPTFEVLRPAIKDAWAASAIALSLDAEMQCRRSRQVAQMVDGFPRRSRIDLMTPAELAIYNAVDIVERIGADVRLTDAVILLAQAREKVADYIEATAVGS